MVLVLTQKNETKPKNDENGLSKYGEPLRPLLLLLRQPDGSLKFSQRNDHAIMCFYCGGRMGEAFEDAVIKEGSLLLQHSGGSEKRWATEVKVSYDDSLKDWVVDSIADATFYAFKDNNRDRTYEMETSQDFGIIRFSNLNIYDATE